MKWRATILPLIFFISKISMAQNASDIANYINCLLYTSDAADE